MQRVIFKKGKKTIIVPWYKFQNKSEIKGLYKVDTKNIIVYEEVTEITLDKCDITQKMSFILPEGQTINFVNCTSGNCYHDLFIVGGHTNIEHGNFNCIRLKIQEGLSTTLNLEDNSNFADVKILSSKIHITGNIHSNYMYLSSNTLELQKSNLDVSLVHIYALQLTMEDCKFYGSGDIDFNYQNLDMKDTYFESNDGSLNLSKVTSGNFLYPNSLVTQKLVSYDIQQPLKSENILGEKSQAMVSLISILKGASQKIEDQNSEDVQLISSKIEDSANQRIEIIEKQIALLEEEKRQLMENTDDNQMKVEELFQNRKIKSIGAKKR